MKTMKNILFLVSLLVTTFLNAQSFQKEKKGFCIILSTTSFTEAKRVAKEATTKLDLNADYRSLIANKITGLTMPKQDCIDAGLIFPYYKARGVDANDLIDDGDFVSIEYSNKYKGFAKGYYIVVISSGDINNKEPIFLKAKKFYKSAYIKYALVNY